MNLALPLCSLVLVLMSLPALMASSPVQRATNDRYADLIDSLIRKGRFEDAIEICQAQQKLVEPQSDAMAWWTIRHSEVMSARQLAQPTYDEIQVSANQKPVVDLIGSYPKHDRRLFLEAQRIAVQGDAARHSVLRAAVSPNNDAASDAATRQLLRATTASLDLSDQVGERRSEIDSSHKVAGVRPKARDFALADDLLRLQQELQVDAVSLALMQTELFPPNSVDFIAAATKAEQAAATALTKLGVDTPARREVERLQVEAIFRAGQLKRAEAALARVVRSFMPAVPARVIAMIARLNLAMKNLPRVQSLLESYYGSSPLTAPPSIEMDLARLDYLLQTNQASEVGTWLEQIEQRGGRYARRRAEAISLATLRRSSANGTEVSQVDPSIIAAQGQDWLRRGEPARAGELIAAAAAAETNPDRAIQRAIESAAAFKAAGRVLDAVDVLAEIPVANSEGANASQAHLQSAVLMSTIDLPTTAKRIEELLRQNLKSWTSAATAPSVRKWLIKILLSTERRLEAAEAATKIPVERVTAEEIHDAIELWQSAATLVEEDQYEDFAKRFQQAFQPLLKREEFTDQYAQAATLLLDRDSISDLQFREPGSAMFVAALLQFRRSGQPTDALQTIPQELLQSSNWRLMRDGQKDPQHRQAIAKLLSTWNGSEPSLEQAQRLIWLEDVPGAVSMLNDMAGKSASEMKRAAALLGESNNKDAQKQAIQFWDRLAAGTSKGSELWHQAKLAGIDLLIKIGEQSEAKRRAKFVLLTMPDVDDSYRKQYEAQVR